jgi:hypothetical protein
MQAGKYMDMILRSINSVKFTISFVKNSPDVFVKFFTIFIRDGGFSVLRAEDDVIEGLGEMAHGYDFFWN